MNLIIFSPAAAAHSRQDTKQHRRLLPKAICKLKIGAKRIGCELVRVHSALTGNGFSANSIYFRAKRSVRARVTIWKGTRKKKPTWKIASERVRWDFGVFDEFSVEIF